jgi:predicted TIM-barrel fold metal-dependent hydrolase
MPKIIDMHCHVYPPEVANADPNWPAGDCPVEIEALLECHAQAGIDFCVVTNLTHYLTKKPSEYAKLLYFDTASYFSLVIKLGIDTIGIERMVFGSNAPPLTPMLPRMQEPIDELDISRADKNAIYSGNLIKLLGLATNSS